MAMSSSSVPRHGDEADRSGLRTDALTGPIRFGDVRRYARAVRSELPKRLSSGARYLVLIGVLLAFVMLMMVWPMLEDLLGGDVDAADLGIIAIALIAPLGVLVVWVWLCVRLIREDRRRYRLHRFAADNGWRYDPWLPTSWYHGMYAMPGAVEDVFDRTVTPGASPVEVATYRGTTGTGKSRTIRQTDYVRVQLGVVLPHIVLDARANDRPFGRTNLPIGLTSDQRLIPEGPFADAFRLYCPSGYETDALYLFPPDVLAVMLDHARDLDVEIVDDTLYLCAPKNVVSTDPQRWRSLLTAVDAISAKARQWEAWRDDRLTPDSADPLDRPIGVAPAGRRLRQRFEWWWVIAGVLLLGFGLYSLISDFVTWLISLGS
jgi:hypothetical protein